MNQAAQSWALTTDMIGRTIAATPSSNLIKGLPIPLAVEKGLIFS